MLQEFKENGYIHLTDVINPTLLKETLELSIKIKEKYSSYSGQPRDWGTGIFWSGFEMASKLDPKLFSSYTSEVMLNLSKELLETQEPYLYNDQVVIKNPKEPFTFEPHFDNQYGPDPNAALKGEFRTVNISWILTDMPTESGPLLCQSNKTGKWQEIQAKAGDVVAIDGNTVHASNLNNSDNIRALYACVYSTHPIGTYTNNPMYNYPNFKGFYNEKFTECIH